MKKILLIIFTISIYFINVIDLRCQCCAFGTPTAGTANVGTVPENNVRTSVFYRFGNAEKYFFGTDEASIPGTMKNSVYNFLGLSLGYGITEKWTIETEFGYFLNKKQQLRSVPAGYSDIIENSGLTNFIVSGKYNLIKNYDYDIEWTLGAGIKIPFSTDRQTKDGVEFTTDMQTSTRAYGGVIQSYFKKSFVDYDLNLYLVNRVEINAADNKYFRTGNSYSTSIFASKKIIEGLFGILQFRNEIKDSDVNTENSQLKYPSGSSIIFISPQLSYTYEKLNVALLYDFPIYKNYYEKQLAVKNAFTVNFSYLVEI